MESPSHDLIRVPGSGISKSGKFLLKLRAHRSGKFVPREINPLYSTIIVGAMVGAMAQ